MSPACAGKQDVGPKPMTRLLVSRLVQLPLLLIVIYTVSSSGS